MRRSTVPALLLAAAALVLGAVPAAASAQERPVNTGTPGSVCRASYPGGATDPALDSTILGALPAAYEVGAPAGGGDVQRVMIFVHGGGWYRVGPGMLDADRAAAAAWRGAGWETVNTSYRACRHSLDDVLALYDAVRTQVGPAVPICLRGESAGGQLALMVAAERPDVACVIAEAAPTDFFTIRSQGAAAGLTQAPPLVFGYARAAFGRRRLKAVSPVSNVASVAARVLLAQAADDPVIPAQQQQELADVLRAARPDASVDTDLLPAGDTVFVHGTTSADGLSELDGRVAALVAPFGSAPVSAPPKPAPLRLPSLLQQLLKLF